MRRVQDDLLATVEGALNGDVQVPGRCVEAAHIGPVCLRAGSKLA